MQDKIYPLDSVLSAFTKYKNPKVTKRLIFDKSKFGKLGSKWLIGFFMFIPFIEYALIFNPTVFAYLGIAQAIVLFIVLLSMVMILIFALSSYNNSKVVDIISVSWQHYFPDIDLKLITTSGATPYRDFYKHYEIILNNGTSHEELNEQLNKAFKIMQEENKDLIEAIKRDKS